MIQRFRPLLLLAPVLALLLMVGCSPSLVKTTPKLPPGFLEARVPACDLSAYLYVSQESPITIPLERFGDPAQAPNNPKFATMPESLEINRLALAVGPNLDSFGGSIAFNDDLQAEMAEDVASGRPEVIVWREGRELNLVRGTGGWANALEGALRTGDASPFEDAYPDIWDLMRLLPEAPPKEPVAAGFVHVSQDILDSLVTRAGLELEGVAQALGAINVSDVVFAAYADTSLTLPAEVGPDYFNEAGVGAVFVARSAYPGFLLSFFLGTFADRVDLEKGSLANGQGVMFREMDDMHLVAKSVGNTLFLTLAPTREKAEALMTSVLEPQLGG